MNRFSENYLARAKSLFGRLKLSSSQLAVASALFIALVNNAKLWSLFIERLDLRSASGLACISTAYLALVSVISVTILLAGTKYLLKPLVIVLMLSSAVLSYFTQQLGVVFDKEMIHNIAETVRDRNQQEAFELMTVPLASHVFLLGVLPSLLVVSTKVIYQRLPREVFLRLAYGGTLVAVSAVMLLANFKYLAFFSQQNHDLRCWATPTYAVHSLRKYFAHRPGQGPEDFHALGQDAAQEKFAMARTVGVMVVGETARADHFSLNGYPRTTTPRLGKRRIINFTRVRSSGTSTAYSVPSMFSFLGEGNYTPKKAARQSNVLDVLERAGVEVVWIDNNSSSKGVCDRIGSVKIRNRFDEVLLEQMEQHLDDSDGDILIVLHAMGSHGPAYHRRYPPEFEVFKPCCKSDSPQKCSDDELVNAYDNTIVYTDFVLDQVIEHLQQRSEDEATFLFYASDHGESLGEDGLYLHGLPDFLAPAAQTHIPMLAWLSDTYIASHTVDYARVQERSAAQYSHDNISHTLLGMFEVETSSYVEQLDLLR